MSKVVIDTVSRDPGPGNYMRYYQHGFCCGNCGKYQHIYVLKGRSLSGLGIDCANCGCYEKFRTAASNWSDK